MVKLYAPKYITVPEAENYASHAGFSQTIVPGTKYTQIQTVVAIAIAESSLNQYAYNGNDPNGGSFGLLQINGIHFNSSFNENDAYNPQKAFNYAYQLSNHGTNFNPWSTFTNKAYLQHIDVVGLTGVSLSGDGWWLYPRIDNIGDPDPFGGIPKPDANILVPDGYPVANILQGIVSGINSPNGQIPDFGATVTIKLNKPLNNLATHISFIHLQDVTVREGQKVGPGDIIGHSGGNKAAGKQKVVLGFALYHGNYYGYDGWEYMTKDNLLGKLNPVPVIESISKGDLLLSNFSSGTENKASQFVKDALMVLNNKVSLTPNDSVIQTLYYIDSLLTLENPFDVTQGSNNPLDWIGDFLYITFVVDLVALTLRILIFLMGAYILFKVFDRIVNVSGFIGKLSQ